MIKCKYYVNSTDKLEKNLHAHIKALYIKPWLYIYASSHT